VFVSLREFRICLACSVAGLQVAQSAIKIGEINRAVDEDLCQRAFLPNHPDSTFNGFVAITRIVLLNQADTLALWNTHEIKVIPHNPTQSVPPYRVISIFIQWFGYDHIKYDF
jgi:hypothetical protein